MFGNKSIEVSEKKDLTVYRIECSDIIMLFHSIAWEKKDCNRKMSQKKFHSKSCETFYNRANPLKTGLQGFEP